VKPPPLIPADTTIPRLPWVPIYADRLWESDFFAVATDAEFKAAFCLWLKSWNQTPPGSLPTDDRLLCRLAELGGSLAKWQKVKRIALRHWIECDDGRLYHPVVSEIILETAVKLAGNRNRTSAATASRWKNSEQGIRNGVRNGSKNAPKSLRNGDDLEIDLEIDRTPPPYPPRDGEGGKSFSTNSFKGKRSGGLALPTALNPKIIGHALPCACPNCTRWVEQQRTA
jgi:hypothetical protein